MFSSRIRTLVRQQWAGRMALFLVLTGGSACALDGSNTVFSDDIVELRHPNDSLRLSVLVRRPFLGR
jgi:hypothetical protein